MANTKKAANSTAKKAIEKTMKEDKINKELNNNKLQNTSQEQLIEGVLLTEVLSLLQKKKDNTLTQEAYDAFVEKLHIKSYLPMEQKAQILISLIINVVYTDGFVSELAAMDLEMRKLFKVLLAYTDVNQLSVDNYPIDFGTYDIIVESGLYDLILNKCEKDYNRFINMIQQALNFESVMQVYTNMSQINPAEMQKGIEEANKFMQGFSSQDLEHLSKIATINDPLVADIAKLVRDNKL